MTADPATVRATTARATDGPVAFAAVDLGATSGRVVVGVPAGGTLALQEVARFPNEPLTAHNGLHWDVHALYRQALAGLARAVRTAPVVSVGVDAWAVDYGLLRDGRLLGDPFHYRDARTAAGVTAVHARVDAAELYARNGLAHLPFTTVFQLAADAPALAHADRLLLIPDLLTYWLTGQVVAERTNASTTGLLSIRDGTWDADLAARLEIPERVLPPLVEPGTLLGRLTGEAAARVGAGAGLGGGSAAVEVTAVGSHDTASAVVAVPAADDAFAYVSCGTWGLVGVETESPVLTEDARRAGFTNEGGVDGRTRFLRNVMGLWLLSESMRTWGGTTGIEGLLAQAEDVGDVPVFDVDDPRFLAPGDMPARINAWLREHDLPPCTTRARLVRCIVESLAQAFADAVAAASRLAHRDVRVIHLVGGGAQNALLCRATAARAGLPVVAGPVEATAIGNILVQARAHGAVRGDLEALRAVVAASTRPLRYEP